MMIPSRTMTAPTGTSSASRARTACRRASRMKKSSLCKSITGSSIKKFLQRPFVRAVGPATTVGRKKAAAELPEPRPDFFAVGLRNFQTVNGLAPEKLETPFRAGRRQRPQFPFHLEQKHEPVRLALIAGFADQAGQMQIGPAQLQTDFLPRFADGAGVGRFAERHLQFAAARAPMAAIRFPGALQQQHLVTLVEDRKST